MAKHKPSSKPLTRLFERSNSPAYVVSPDGTIIYANDACAAWLGLELSSLISTRCSYASPFTTTPDRDPTSGLCPPPSLLGATPESEPCETPGWVWAGVDQPTLSWRRATMSPMFDGNQELMSVLVVCGSSDLREPPPVDPIQASTDSRQLHLALAQIRAASDRRYSLESLVGTSPFANRLRRQFNAAIESKSDCLIFGPPGSGKEHAARTIHAVRQQDQAADLLTIHCSIADQPLIQQRIKELAGNQPGSKLPPTQQEPGRLLLLNVDQLGEAAQLELLGFFQLPNFALRCIATASVPLITLAEQGSFSVELAYHLSTMTIEMVSMARRQIDVPLIAQALLERDNFRRDRQLTGFSQEAMHLLTEYHWPENLDQLSRMIQIAIENSSTTIISEQDLPEELIHAIKALRIGTARETSIQLDSYLGQIESELIRRALVQAKGNKSRASKLLGISRAKLLRRIQFFDLGSSGTRQPAVEKETGQVDSSAFEELDS